jgi:Cu/Ag efflux pump CusA
MIRQIVALSVKFRVLVVGAAAALLALAVVQLPGAPVDELPEFAPPHVQIQTEALGLSAAEVEQLITVPMEHDLLNGVSRLEQIRSESVPGLSSIDLIFEPGTDPLDARQSVQERMSQAFALPPVGTPPVIVQPTSSTSRVMMVGLRPGKDLSLVDLSVLARWKIKPRLMAVPGVSNVTIWGQRDKQLQVQVDPARLHQNGVTLTQVVSTTGNALWASPLSFVEASTPGTGGFVDMSNQRLAIQHVLPITTPQTLASVTIQDAGGRTLRLDQVSNVVADHQPLIGDAVLPEGQGLMLVIEKFPGANTRDVTTGVEEALAAQRPGLTGVTIDTDVYQAQSFVDTVLRNVGLWALLGAVVLVAVLALVLLSWQRVVVGLATVVLSLVTATYVLFLLGTGLNLMVLAGLAVALGLVIDDAVAAATGEVAAPRLYATLIALLAPVPLVFLGGVAEAFSRPAILAYALAVGTATLVSLTVGPALARMLFRGEGQAVRPSPVSRLAGRAFDRTVPWFVGRARWVSGTVALLIFLPLVALVALAAAPQDDARPLLPAPQNRSLLIHWEAVPGTSLPEMARITNAAVRELGSVHGVRSVGGQLGRAVTSDQVANVDAGEIWVTLADSADYEATVGDIQKVLRGYPGVRSDLIPYAQDRVRDVQEGTSDALVVRVYGADLGVLQQKAEELRQRIAGVPGVHEPQVQAQSYEPAIDVEVNLVAAQRYGINPGDVRRTATTYFSGLAVGQLYEEQAVYDVVVKGAPSTLSAPAAVADLLIDTPSGDQVRLGDVASVKVAPEPSAIGHDGTLRSIDVTADVRGRDAGAVLSDVRAQVRSTPMPLEYHAEVLNDLARQQNRILELAGLAAAVAIVSFLLLQAALGSWRLAGLVFLTLPLAAAGGVVAAALAGGLATLGALIGFFTILGIAARNGVVLVGDYQRLAGGAPDAVLEATRRRSRQVLLTAAATALVMLPPLLLGGVPGTEVLRPLSAVVVGGLVSSTLLALLVLPALLVHLRLAPAAQPPVGQEVGG